MAIRGLLRVHEQSTRMEHIVAWVWAMSPDQRNNVQQDLARLTVNRLHGPPRASVLEVLHARAYVSELELSVDPDRDDNVLAEAKSITIDDKRALRNNVRRVWEQGPLETILLSLSGSTGGGPASGGDSATVSAARSADLEVLFHRCSQQAANLLQLQEEEDSAFQLLMRGHQPGNHSSSAHGVSPTVTHGASPSGCDVLTGLKASKSIGIDFPTVRVDSMPAKSLGRQIILLLLACERAPLSMGSYREWLHTSSEMKRFTDVFQIATRDCISVRRSLGEMESGGWKPKTPVQLMAAAFAPQGEDSINLEVEKDFCLQTKTLHQLVEHFSDWLMAYDIYNTAAGLPDELKSVVIQDTGCKWVVKHALSCVQAANKTHASEVINGDVVWQTSPDACLRVLTQLKTYEQSRVTFASSGTSKPAKVRRTSTSGHTGGERRSDDRRRGTERDRRDASPPRNRRHGSADSSPHRRDRGKREKGSPPNNDRRGTRRFDSARGSDALRRNAAPSRKYSCHNWARDGTCGFGDNCRFSHDGAPSAQGIVPGAPVVGSAQGGYPARVMYVPVPYDPSYSTTTTAARGSVQGLPLGQQPLLPSPIRGQGQASGPAPIIHAQRRFQVNSGQP